MSKPYFEAGEEVVLVSRYYPEFNGDGEILEVMAYSDFDVIDVECCEYGYKLTIPNHRPDTKNFTALWCQCALRKKQERGQDVKTFMTGLKTPIEVE